MSPGPFDAGIPVLTEVLQENAPAPAPASAPSYAATPAPASRPAVWRAGAGVAAAVPAPAPVIDLVVPADADIGAGMDGEAAMTVEPAKESVAAAVDLAAIEQALSERIVRQLMPRVDALVAERLDRVLQHLAADLQAGLGESIAQAVAASVRQELAALQAPAE